MSLTIDRRRFIAGAVVAGGLTAAAATGAVTRAEAEEARRAAEADMLSDISLDSPVSLEGGETPTSLDDIQF